MKKLTLCLFVAFLVLNAYSQITVNASNNVGIKTTTPNEALEVNGNIRGNVAGALNISTGSGTFTAGPQNTAFCHLYTNVTNGFAINAPITMIYSYPINGYVSSQGVAYDIPFNTNYTQRLVIKGSGYIGINNSSPTCALDVTGIIKMNGSVVSSDARLKDNIKDLSGSLASLTNLHGVNYKLIPNAYETLTASLTPASLAKSDTSAVGTKQTSPKLLKPKPQEVDTALYNRNHIGFLAQEVQKVYPELVYADKNGILSVDYVSMIPILVESIKEQQSTINDLKAIVEQLKKKAGI